MTPSETIPYGYCHCGCGQKTTIASYPRPEFGWVKGEPIRFLSGHNGRYPRKKTLYIKMAMFICFAKDEIEFLVDEDDLGTVQAEYWEYYQRSQGYIASTTRRPMRSLHNILVEPRPGFVTDHINGTKLDNRRCNLREAIKAQNSANAGVRKNNKSGFKEVSRNFSDLRYDACITIDGKTIHLGRYLSAKAAARRRIR